MFKRWYLTSATGKAQRRSPDLIHERNCSVVLSSMAQKTLDPEKSSEKKFAKSHTHTHKKKKMLFPVVYIFSYPNNQAKEVPSPSLLREWERGLRAENQSGTALRLKLSWQLVTNANSVERNRKITQSCLTLGDLMDWGLPGSSVHGIFQAIVLEWIATSFSRGSSQPRDRTPVSHIVDRHFTIWATREVL